MPCIKCKKELQPDFIWCPYCGKKQISTTAKSTTRRPNGAGWAIKRGRTWTSYVIVGFEDKDGKKVPDIVSLGGFPTKTSALDYVPVLKAAVYLDKKDRNAALRATRQALTIDEALKIIRQYKKNVLTEEITFHALYERWLPFYEPRIDKSTMAGHKAAMNHFRDLWPIPFAALSADDIQECIDCCPKGRRTQENMKSLGKRLYEFAIGRKIAVVNCADYVYIASDGNRRRAALKPEHVKMIKEQIGRYPFADYIYCLCYLGFRPNEMLQLTKDSFHVQDGVEFIVGGFKTAAGTDRVVTIPQQIAPIIHKLLKAPGPFIFPGPDGEMIDDTFLRERVFYPMMEKLGIQSIPKTGERAEYVPYSCRHFFANLLKNAKGSDKDKAALIGHTDYETTKRVYQSEDLRSMQAVTNSFGDGFPKA